MKYRSIVAYRENVDIRHSSYSLTEIFARDDYRPLKSAIRRASTTALKGFACFAERTRGTKSTATVLLSFFFFYFNDSHRLDGRRGRIHPSTSSRDRRADDSPVLARSGIFTFYVIIGMIAADKFERPTRPAVAEYHSTPDTGMRCTSTFPRYVSRALLAQIPRMQPRFDTAESR